MKLQVKVTVSPEDLELIALFARTIGKDEGRLSVSYLVKLGVLLGAEMTKLRIDDLIAPERIQRKSSIDALRNMERLGVVNITMV